jgi:hypothetical protein
MIKLFAYTNKENENDRNYDLKVITQYHSHFSIDILKIKDKDQAEDDDSFESSEISSQDFEEIEI